MNRIKKSCLFRVISLVLILTFISLDISYAYPPEHNTGNSTLATLPASQNPIAKLEIQAALQRTQIRYAESEDAIRLLHANNAECLLLSSGKYLVTKGVAQNDLKLLRAVIHEDIEAIMQILAKEDRYKYQGIKELILKHFPPSESNNLSTDLYVNHILAIAFEWIILLEQGMILRGEISADAKDFVKAIEPIIKINKHNYFTAEFWDSKTRSEKIRVARNSGMVFYQVSSNATRQDNGGERKIIGQTLKSLTTLLMQYLGVEQIEDKVLLNDATRATNTFRLYKENKVFTKEFTDYLISVHSGDTISIIHGTQSEARDFEVVVVEKKDTPLLINISSVNSAILYTIDIPNSDRAIQIKANKRNDGRGRLFEDFREQLKFVTVINALTNLGGEEGYSIFTKHLGEDRAKKFFANIKNIREFYREKFGGKSNDKIIINEETDPVKARPFIIFVEQLKEKLNLQTISEVEKEILYLQEGVDRFIDQNDLLIELISLMVERGVWTYDAATRMLFVEQINVGLVDGRIASAIKEGKQVDLEGYSFGFQSNPERQNRAATGKLNAGETFLYREFIKRGLPLERWIPFTREGSRFEYLDMPNPFPHLRNSLNLVSAKIIPQEVVSENIEDAFHFLERANPVEGYRLRLFLNAPYAGLSFDHLHFQGFYKVATIEKMMDDRQNNLELLKDRNGVKYYAAKTYPASSTIVVEGPDRSATARAVAEVCNLALVNSEGSLSEKSKFTYNVLFVYEDGIYRAYIITKDLKPNPFQPERQNRIEQDVIVYTNDSARGKDADELKIKIETAIKTEDKGEYGKQTSQGIKDGLILFIGRPATVEMVDTLIYDSYAKMKAYEGATINEETMRYVLKSIFETVRYKDFTELKEKISGLAPVHSAKGSVAEDISHLLASVLNNSLAERARKAALYSLIALFNNDEERFNKAWSVLESDLKSKTIIERARAAGVEERIKNNVLKKSRAFDASVNKIMTTSENRIVAWSRAAQQGVDSGNLRVLNLIAVPPERTGSGMVVKNLMREHGKRGREYYLQCADYRPVSSKDLGLPDNEAIDTIIFSDTTDPAQAGTATITFPIPTFSKGMPFTHTRYKDMNDLQLIEFLETYYEHLEAVIRKFKPDVIHTNHIFFLNTLSKLAAPWIPIVSTTHGTEEKMLTEDGRLIPLVAPAARSVERILSVSPQLAEEAARVYGIDKTKAITVSNGYDSNIFHPVVYSRQDILKKYGIKSTADKIVLFVGKYSEWKGIEYLIEAAGIMKREGRQSILTLIAGGGSEQLRQAYQQRIDELDLNDCVRLIGLYGDRQKEIAELMNIADIFTLPSVSEPFGMVILEALACGCRVVATDRGGPPSFVPADLRENKLAALVEPIHLTNAGVVDANDVMPFSKRLAADIAGVLATSASSDECERISKEASSMSWGKAYEQTYAEYLEVVKERLQGYKQTQDDKLTVFLNSLNAGNSGLTGNKASELHAIINARLPGVSVPEGFVVTTEAFGRFITSVSGLKEKIQKLDELSKDLIMPENDKDSTTNERIINEQIDAIAKDIRNSMLMNNIPSEIVGSVKRSYETFAKDRKQPFTVAVRSSAIGEDSADASFAGQHETKLDIVSMDGILKSLKEVWVSLFSKEAVQYRNNLLKKCHTAGKGADEFSYARASMAVIIQEFIDAKASGVVYVINIKTGQPEIVVEAVCGSGELHVQGGANPDSWRFIFDGIKPVLLERVVQPKPGDGLSLDEYIQPALSDEEVMNLAVISQRLNADLQRHNSKNLADIEYAISKDGDLSILQMRPLTAVPSSDINPICTGVSKETAAITAKLELEGKIGNPGVAKGRLVIINVPGDYPEHDNLEVARRIIKDGDILCTPTVNIGWTTLFGKLAGLIVERGGTTSHSAAIARENGIPAVVGVRNACALLAKYNDKEVTLDAYNHAVFEGSPSLVTTPLNDLLWRSIFNDREYDRREPSHFVDSKGNEWAKKPVYPLSPLQLQLYYEAMLKAKALFQDINMPMFIKDDVIYVGYDELIAIGNKMCEWGLSKNEEFFDERVHVVDEFVKMAEQFDVTTVNISSFFDIYKRMIMHFHMRAGFRRRSALLMREKAVNSLPEQIRNLILYLVSMNAPMEITETKKRDLEYRGMLYEMKQAEKDVFLHESDTKRIAELLKNDHSALFNKISDFLRQYRIERYQRDDWNAPLPYASFIGQIRNDLASGLDHEPVGAQILRPLQGFKTYLRSLEPHIKRYDPSFDFDSFERILLLSERQSTQVDNERHLQHRYQLVIRQKLLDFGNLLAGKGVLRSPNDILTKSEKNILELSEIPWAGRGNPQQSLPGNVSMASALKATVDYLEFHPSNLCNLCNQPCCKGTCTYDGIHEGGDMFPYEQLDDVAKLKPSLILIVGGGEPSLYKYKDKKLPDIVKRLHGLLPDTSFVLCTNGVKYLPGDWQHNITSIRIALHGYTGSTFESGAPWHVIKAWTNMWRYFEGPIGELWATYRFDRKNYLEIPELAERLWMHWSLLCERDPRLRKKEFGFKMLYAADDNRPDDPFHLSNPDAEMQKRWAEAVEAIKKSGRPFGRFLKDAEEGHIVSNFTLPKEIITGKLLNKETTATDKCWLAGNSVLVGANGKIYPCCVMAASNKFSFGNVSQSPEELLKARRALFDHPLHSCSSGCRLAGTLMWNSVRNKMSEVATSISKTSNIASKDLSRGMIDEIEETHPALDGAANDGRMFAITLDQLAGLQIIEADNDKLVELFMANLMHLRAPPDTRNNLLERFKDPAFRENLLKGFNLMQESIKVSLLPKDKPVRLCIVVEDKNLPTIVFKDPYNNLIAHSGKGEKTSTPYTSIYAGYNSLEVALKTNQEDGFKKIISHEADDIARGYHLDEKVADAAVLYDNVLDLYDAQSATVLLTDLLYAQLNENRFYEIKYDTSRLITSQIEIIEEYVRLLQLRSSNPDSIKLRPFSSAQGSKESLIAVYCTGKDFKGEGHVDVTIPDGELKEYLLRIAGMVNIALASSNIPDNLSREEVDKYRPIMSYIKNQYKAILGEELAIPDSPEDILKVIRRIVLGLPKSMRMNTGQIEEFNRLAKQALIAA